MEEENQSKGLPIVPIVIAGPGGGCGDSCCCNLQRQRRKNVAQLEEEDLMDEVDRFTEDE